MWWNSFPRIPPLESQLLIPMIKFFLFNFPLIIISSSLPNPTEGYQSFPRWWNIFWLQSLQSSLSHSLRQRTSVCFFPLTRFLSKSLSFGVLPQASYQPFYESQPDLLWFDWKHWSQFLYTLVLEQNVFYTIITPHPLIFHFPTTQLHNHFFPSAPSSHSHRPYYRYRSRYHLLLCYRHARWLFCPWSHCERPR